MRAILLLLLSLPAFAQAPDFDIRCEGAVCTIKREVLRELLNANKPVPCWHAA